MPLEATHIRFALDLSDKYKIKNIDQYIAGSVYPDSHCITGIDKKLTHDDSFLLPEFASDDFKKGWQTHLICDLAYEEVVKKIFCDIFPEDCDFSVEQNWENITAIKIILDMEDMQAFDIQRYLKCLEYVDNPNNESIEEVKKSNQLIINLYKNKKNTTVDDNINNLLALILKVNICKQTKTKAENFLKDAEALIRIKTIYQEMLNNYLEIENETILFKK